MFLKEYLKYHKNLIKRGSTILTIEKVVRQMHSVANCFQKRSQSDKKFECPFGKKMNKNLPVGNQSVRN